MILEEKEYNDYHNAMVENKNGMQSHLFFGHGPTQDRFDKRDLATTNDLVYGDLKKTAEIIDPHMDQTDGGRARTKLITNAKQEELPSMVG